MFHSLMVRPYLNEPSNDKLVKKLHGIFLACMVILRNTHPTGRIFVTGHFQVIRKLTFRALALQLNGSI